VTTWRAGTGDGEISPQSLRALDRLVESRGAEPMRDMLEEILIALEDGHTVTVSIEPKS